MIEQAKPRIGYIDLVKGWVIFLVIWVHADHPVWVTANFVNSFLYPAYFLRNMNLASSLKNR